MTNIKGNTIMKVLHNAFGIMQVLMFDRHLNVRPVKDEARHSYLYEHSWKSSRKV